MTKEELVELRKETQTRVQSLRHVGDYGAGAVDIRENAEALLKLIDHLVERMR